MTLLETEALQHEAQVDAWESEGGRPAGRPLAPVVSLIENIRVFYRSGGAPNGMSASLYQANREAIWKLVNHAIDIGNIDVRTSQPPRTNAIVDFAMLRTPSSTKH